jgi:putative peptidoglycan lipid II flippase
MTMIVALLVTPADEIVKVRAMCIAVLIGGVLQFALCWIAVRRAGVHLRFGRPKLTPAVRELLVLVLPATAAAGVYQISQIFYLYFSTLLGEGALTNLNYADRLNQLPLSIIGTALGVAILPSLSQAVERRDEAGAADVQARAMDLSMLLALPATLALMVAAGPIIAVIFHGGEYTVQAAVTTGNILAILASGLPAYVLVKVLQPAFYARKDVRTPVIISMTILLLNIPANFLLIPHIGIYSLPTVMSVSSWINFLILFAILYARGQFRMPAWLVGRVSKQLIAAVLMGAVLFALRRVFEGWFFGETLQKIVSLGTLVGSGMLVYFGVAWIIGGVDKEAIASLRRKKAPQ